MGFTTDAEATQALAAGSMGASSFGAGMSAGGSYNSAKSRQDMLDAEASIADQQAKQAILSGQTAAQNSMLKTGAVFGAQRAQLGANGVQLGSGSATDILASTKYIGARDAMTIMDNATRTAWAYRAESAIDSSAAGGIKPGMDAFSSLLGSAPTVAGNWYRFKQLGVGTGGGASIYTPSAAAMTSGTGPF